MYQIYVEIWEATKSSRKVLIYRMYWQLKIYAWIFLITLGCYVVLNTLTVYGMHSLMPIIGNTIVVNVRR